jgi:hypothetical protein
MMMAEPAAVKPMSVKSTESAVMTASKPTVETAAMEPVAVETAAMEPVAVEPAAVKATAATLSCPRRFRFDEGSGE